MKTVIIYYPELDNFDDNEIDGGIYENVTIVKGGIIWSLYF